MVKRVVLVLLGLVVLVLVGGAVMIASMPRVAPAPDLHVEGTPTQVTRGEYLFNHVTVCVDCHSDPDWTKFANPPKPGTTGRGGLLFDEDHGIPGTIYASNITPYALEEWTDGEIARATTVGVSRDGRPLFPIMPYPSYRNLSPDDLHALIAYIRTLEPIANDVPESSLNFPLNIIVRMIPQDAELTDAPDPADTVAHGEYLAHIGGCRFCHTPMERGQPNEALAFSGGEPSTLPTGTVRAANITPDPDTGIGAWSREEFIARFRAYAGAGQPLGANGFDSVMPWTEYAGMTDADLGALYDYLMTLEPVTNAVVRWEPNP